MSWVVQLHSSLGNRARLCLKNKTKRKRIGQEEERISELEDRLFENTQSEEEKEKRIKNKAHLKDLENSLKKTNLSYWS